MVFSGPPISSTNEADRNDITEILLKFALSTITLILFLRFLDGPGSRYLQEVDVPIMDNNRCRYYIGNVIYGSNICAGYSQGGRDACQVSYDNYRNNVIIFYFNKLSNRIGHNIYT